MAKRFYSLEIGSVDGERNYMIGSPDAEEVLEFARQYDHEGSALFMETVEKGEEDTIITEYYNSEEFFSMLVRERS